MVGGTPVERCGLSGAGWVGQRRVRLLVVLLILLSGAVLLVLLRLLLRWWTKRQI